MITIQRIGKIIDKCRKLGITASFQTNYAGIDGRDRLAVDTDEMFMEKFLAYLDADNAEERVVEIEQYLESFNE